MEWEKTYLQIMISDKGLASEHIKNLQFNNSKTNLKIDRRFK